MDDSNTPPTPPAFDQQKADGYVGKYILVGLTYLDHQGVETRRAQLHGVIEKASPDGITVNLRGVHDGESLSMPPDLGAIVPAQPATYNLHSTGESVEKPDLLATWTINAPRPEP